MTDTETAYVRHKTTGVVQSIPADRLPEMLAVYENPWPDFAMFHPWEQVSEAEARESDPRVFGKADADVEHVRAWGIGDEGEVVKYGPEVQWAGWSE